MDIKSLPWYGQLALFVAIGLLFLGIFYKLYYAPGLDEIKGLQERKQTLEGEVKRLEQMKREVGRIENDIASKTENLAKLKELLPNRKEIAQILQTIQERAKDCNLEVRTFVPKGEVPKGITISQKVVTKEGDREKTEVKNVTVNDVYAEWPIDISVSGRYHNLAIFYVHLCSLSRIFNINNFTLSAVSNQSPDQTLQASVEAKTYIFLEKEESQGQTEGNKKRVSSKRG